MPQTSVHMSADASRHGVTALIHASHQVFRHPKNGYTKSTWHGGSKLCRCTCWNNFTKIFFHFHVLPYKWWHVVRRHPWLCNMVVHGLLLAGWLAGWLTWMARMHVELLAWHWMSVICVVVVVVAAAAYSIQFTLASCSWHSLSLWFISSVYSNSFALAKVGK